MSTPSVFVLDSNVFMEASRRYYAFDLVPAFWEVLADQAMNGRVLSVDRVRDEIARGQDALTDWANGNFREWFASTDGPDVLEAYRQLMTWANSHTQFTRAAVAEFAQQRNADAWVVAFSMARTHTVVTHEQFDPNVRRRVPIPNVCQHFDVHYLDTFRMLRDLSVRLS